MKRIDELGISQWPWEETSLCRVTDCNGDFVANSNNPFITRLIAAAPELYECLREAMLMQCGMCKFNPCLNEKCAFRNWRDALAKAVMESEAS